MTRTLVLELEGGRVEEVKKRNERKGPPGVQRRGGPGRSFSVKVMLIKSFGTRLPGWRRRWMNVSGGRGGGV